MDQNKPRDPLFDGVCDRCGEPFDWCWRVCDNTAYHKCADVHPQSGHIGRWIHKDHYDEIIRLRAALETIEKIARFDSDPARNHSAQISYNELQTSLALLAREARNALKDTDA